MKRQEAGFVSGLIAQQFASRRLRTNIAIICAITTRRQVNKFKNIG